MKAAKQGLRWYGWMSILLLIVCTIYEIGAWLCEVCK